MAVSCSSLIACFPGSLLRYCWDDFEMVSVAPGITGITFALTFHMCWISTYFRIFSASFHNHGPVSWNWNVYSHTCIIIIVVVVVVSCHKHFLPGTSLEPMVIPIAQASSFRLQYFPYYVWCSQYSCLLKWIYWKCSLVWLPNFFLNLLLLFWWLQLLLV